MIAISNGSLIYETFKSIIRSFRKTSPPFSPSPFHGEGAGGEVEGIYVVSGSHRVTENSHSVILNGAKRSEESRFYAS